MLFVCLQRNDDFYIGWNKYSDGISSDELSNDNNELYSVVINEKKNTCGFYQLPIICLVFVFGEIVDYDQSRHTNSVGPFCYTLCTFYLVMLVH